MDPIVLRQREFYNSHKTLDINFRINALKTLKKAILAYEDRINKAIKKDVGKSNFETYMCEVGLALSELTYMEKHVRKFSKEKTVYTPLSQFLSRSFEKPSPYGVVLVISPWNYPFLLSIDPLIDALAAGNTVVLKPSEFSPYTSQVIKDMIEEYFEPEYVACVLGDSEVSSKLLDSKFDYIFYTGSKRVGKIVMNKASQYLTPVTLELGGKSPCIIEKDADIKLTARRIVFGKYLNCGQTCVVKYGQGIDDITYPAFDFGKHIFRYELVVNDILDNKICENIMVEATQFAKDKNYTAEEIRARFDYEIDGENLEYYRRRVCYDDIFEALALDSWLYNHYTDMPFVAFALRGIQNETERYLYLQWLKTEIQNMIPNLCNSISPVPFDELLDIAHKLDHLAFDDDPYEYRDNEGVESITDIAEGLLDPAYRMNVIKFWQDKREYWVDSDVDYAHVAERVKNILDDIAKIFGSEEQKI